MSKTRSTPLIDDEGHIQCPHCAEGRIKWVKDSRPSMRYGHTLIRRVRVCTSCGINVKTVEVVEDTFDRLFTERSEKNAIVSRIVGMIEDEVREQMVRRISGPRAEVLSKDTVIDERRLRQLPRRT